MDKKFLKKVIAQSPEDLQIISACCSEAKVKTYWRVRPGWCRRHDYKGNFKAQLSVSGYRRSLSNSILVQIDGHDIRFDAMGYPLLCP